MCRYHVWHRFQMVISYFVSERRFYQRFASLIITYDRCLFLNIKKLQKIIVLIKTKKEANIRYHHWNNAKITRKKRKLMNLIHEIQSLMHYWTSDSFNANWIGMDNKINSKNGILNEYIFWMWWNSDNELLLLKGVQKSTLSVISFSIPFKRWKSCNKYEKNSSDN